MKVLQMRYEILPDGFQKLTMMLDGNCEEECRKAEQKLDKGQDVNVFFANAKRSLDSNSYYWLLTTRIAKALGVPLAEAHNRNLARYGVPMLAGGQCIYAYLEDTEEVERSVLMNDKVHMKATSGLKEGKNGRVFRAYMIMKGSSEMDTEEMAALIDGAISECKEMGIRWQKPWEP